MRTPLVGRPSLQDRAVAHEERRGIPDRGPVDGRRRGGAGQCHRHAAVRAQGEATVVALEGGAVGGLAEQPRTEGEGAAVGGPGRADAQRRQARSAQVLDEGERSGRHHFEPRVCRVVAGRHRSPSHVDEPDPQTRSQQGRRIAVEVPEDLRRCGR